MSRRRSNVDTIAALAGIYAAMATAARLSGSRIGSARRDMGRLARRLAAESTGRSLIAYRVLRGELPVQTRRRRGEYLAVTALAGAAGAITAVSIRRIAIQRRARRQALEEVAETGEPSTVTPISRSATGNVTA
jgi:hypothetical protein